MKANRNIYEFALFKVKDASKFLETNRRAINRLSVMDGYHNSSSFQNLEDPNVFLDIVEWKSIENAQVAQEKFENSDESVFNSYTNLISEIINFGHFTEIKNGFNMYNESKKGDILELVIFHIMEGSYCSWVNSREGIMNLPWK